MRHAVRIAAFTMLLLVAGAAAAATPAQVAAAESTSARPPAAASTASSTPRLPPADQNRMAAIRQYQHDLVTVVALRAQPDYLLGAAILSRPFKDPTPGLDFDSLSERAVAAPGAGPAAEWARLELCEGTTDCPNAEALTYLKEHASDNAAVWIVAMDFANTDKARLFALEKAAAAGFYDDYYGQTLAGVAKAVTILPPLPETTAGAHDGQPDNPEGVRMLVALMNMQIGVRPGFGPLNALCDRASVNGHPNVKSECLKLAHTLQWGSSPLARAMGLHLQRELDPDTREQAGPASRDVAWQVQQYSALLQQALTNPAQASRWLQTARNGGTELSLMLATLRANRVPTEAPADFKSMLFKSALPANGIPSDAPAGATSTPAPADGAIQ